MYVSGYALSLLLLAAACDALRFAGTRPLSLSWGTAAATALVDVKLDVRGGAAAVRLDRTTGVGRGSTVITMPSPQQYDAEASSGSSLSSTRGRTMAAFANRSSRLGFMRKVFTISLVQMITTAATTYAMMQNKHIPYYLLTKGKPIVVAIAAASLMCVMALSWIPNLRYRKPYNFFLLGLFTLGQAMTMGMFSSQYPAESVLLGSTHTIMALFAVILYSTQPSPSYDLTYFGSGMLALISSLIVSGFANLYLGSSVLDNAMLGATAVVFVAYMVREVQLIVGGETKRTYGEDDYIMAALGLYESIINLLYRMIEIAARMQQYRQKNGNNNSTPL